MDKENIDNKIGKKWYVIHTYSGHENKVKNNLEKRISSTGIEDKVEQILVPTEEKLEKKNGEQKVVEKRMFPGYVLIQMEMDDDAWYVVRNTPGVTGFVSTGTKPLPVRPDEIDEILKGMGLEDEEKEIRVDFDEGDKVRVIDGPFEDFIGIIQKIYPQQRKAKVLVSMFGRETPVELNFTQIESE
ncbi:MAG: transcription termination/antitermination protein NusG [Bacillota bacterium]